MAMCPGNRANKMRCNSLVSRCKKCGSVGCDQRDCSNRTFDGWKCLRCGTIGQKETVK